MTGRAWWVVGVYLLLVAVSTVWLCQGFLEGRLSVSAMAVQGAVAAAGFLLAPALN